MVSPRALSTALAGFSQLSVPSERISNTSTIPGTPFPEDPGSLVAAVQSLNISITNDEECNPSQLTYRLVVPQQYVSPDNFYELQMAAMWYIIDPKQTDPMKRESGKRLRRPIEANIASRLRRLVCLRGILQPDIHGCCSAQSNRAGQSNSI